MIRNAHRRAALVCWLAGAASAAVAGAAVPGAATVTGAAAGVAAGAAPLPPEPDRVLARDIFRDLVALRTTHDVGTTAAAHAIERWLLTAGFDAADVTVVAPPDHPTKGNVVIRYRGTPASRATPVLFLAHLDVVDVSRADWTSDPFTLTERDGFFYGRGAGDVKNGVAALVESLLRLRRERYVPARDLIVALTADEEGGGDANGVEFLLSQHRELVDAGLAINLDGGGGTYRDGRRAWFTLNTSEKVYATFVLEATSPGGHGARPGTDNSIYHLAQALGRLQALEFPVSLNATTRSSLKMMADLDPGPQSADMRALASVPPDAAAAERLSQSASINAQLRTTCTPTLISGGEAENVLPQHARALVQCRLLPADSIVNVQQMLSDAIADPTLRLTLTAPPIVSPESPPSADILAFAAGVVHSMWPGVPIVPGMSAGYTDARHTRNAAIPTYDLGGAWSAPGDKRAHDNDERIGVREFDESVEYTWRLLKAAGNRR